MSDSRVRPERSASPSGSKGHEDADAFFEQVHDALVHIDDPLHLQTHPLARLAAPDARRAESRARALRQRLLDAVESLRPSRETPIGSDAWRRYQVLHLRYVEGLEIAEVRRQLGLGRSEYFRTHRRSIDAFASLLESVLGPPESEREAASDKAAVSRSGSGSRACHNLPIQLTSFVGREREMAEVKRLLAQTRLVTLTGTGGCGKTRLAYQVAAELLASAPDEYRDGVWAVELAALSEPPLVPQAIAFALEVREQPGQPLLAMLVSSLRTKSLLLILDNCEHLLGASAGLADALLRSCPSLRVLATSREPLGIPGETCYRVPSLSLPDPRERPTLTSLSQYEAIRLFVDRAASAMPSFAVTDENAPSVSQICLRLDGMPLAIELAAARVRGLSVEELAARLDDRFHLLTGGSRTALRRQQSLRATIDWSYDLLSEPEKALFRRLAVFVGGWTLEAAEAVCSGGEVQDEAVVDLLLRLVDRSLVVADTERQPTRYRLLETIRQFAGEKLGEAGEAASVRDRHLERYLALVEEAASHVRAGDDRPRWRGRAGEEHDNLLGALAWSLAREEAAGTAIRLGASAAGFWSAGDGGLWTDTEVRDQLGPVLARPGGDPSARLEVLEGVANAEAVAGHWRVARERHEEAVALAREIGDQKLLARALWGLGCLAMNVGDIRRSIPLQGEAAELARASGDLQSLWLFAGHLAATLMLDGDDAAARPLVEEALAVARDLGDPMAIADCLAVLGQLTLYEGDLGRARALLEAALGLARESGDANALSLVLTRLGQVSRAEGCYSEAEARCRDALVAFQRFTLGGDPLRTTGYVLGLAGAWVACARARQAAVLYGAVRGWLDSVGLPVPWGPPRGYERDEEAARVALGEAAFTRAWAEGQAMTLEQAVEYAIRGDEA